MKKIAFLAIALFLRSSAFSLDTGGGTVLDVSARLSRDLKTRVQDHLNRIFGFGRSEVFVQVDVGFSPSVRGDLEKTLKSYLSGESARQEVTAASPQQSAAYQWLFPGLEQQQQGGPSEAFILPGFSAQSGMPQAPSGALGPSLRGAMTPFSDPNFLYAIGLEVKRIFVKIALDYKLDSDAETKVQALVGALLELNPERGDKLLITRFHMPNPIFELFKDPIFLSVVLKWATVAALILAGLLLAAVLAIFVIKTLVGQLERWVEAFALMRHRTMEVKFDLPPELKVALPAIRIQKTEHIEERGESRVVGTTGAEAPPKELSAEELRNLVISIPKDKIPELLHLIGKENPGHIALVLAKLPPETRNGFLTRLPSDKRSQVLTALASPQYIEPGLLWRMKDELEKRISGIVGGEEEMVRTLQATNLIVRMSILKNLETQNPLLFKSVRKRILLFDDLLNFSEQELASLLSRISLQDLTMAISDGIVPRDLKDKILRSLPKKTSQTVEELLAISGKPPQEKILEAQDKIIQTAQKLIGEGGLRHPLSEPALP